MLLSARNFGVSEGIDAVMHCQSGSISTRAASLHPQAHSPTSAQHISLPRHLQCHGDYPGKQLSLSPGTKFILGPLFSSLAGFFLFSLVPLLTHPEHSQLSSGPLSRGALTQNSHWQWCLSPGIFGILQNTLLNTPLTRVSAVALIAITPNKPPLKKESLLTSTHLETSPSCCTSDLAPRIDTGQLSAICWLCFP